MEDDSNIQEIESYAIGSSGHEAIAFSNGKDFMKALERRMPDLILLDIMLPGEDGLSLLQKIRSDIKTKNIPVIMVTAKSTEMDTVKGLEQGADDYITKPFGVMELISRVKAMLRRFDREKQDDKEIIKYDKIVLDQNRRTCFVNGELTELTYKEFELLTMFLSNLGQVLTRDKIMNRVWGTDFAGESRTVDIHVNTLRKKLGSEGDCIKTVRNVGYKLE